MFAKVPPVGRCTKHLTSSRWILLGTNIITLLEEYEGLELCQILLVYIKMVIICVFW